MFLFRFTARPGRERDIHEELSRTGGAYVNVYVDFPEEEAARLVAEHYIRDAGWSVKTFLEVEWLYDAPDDEEGRGYFQDALKAGSCLVFYQWPADAEDAGEDFEQRLN